MDNSKLNEQGYGIHFNVYKTKHIEGFADLHNKIMEDIDIVNDNTKTYYRKRAFVRNLLANMIVSIWWHQPIIMERNSKSWGLKKRYNKLYMSYNTMVEVIDRFIYNDLLIQHIGYYNKTINIGRSTRLEPSQKFITMLYEYCTDKLDYPVKDNPDEVVVMTKRIDTPKSKKKHKSVRVVYKDNRKIRRIRARVVKYNDFIKQFAVTVKADNFELSDLQETVIIKCLKAGMIADLNMEEISNSGISKLKDKILPEYQLSNTTIPLLYQPYHIYPTTTNTTIQNITSGLLRYNLSMHLSYLCLHRVYNRQNWSLGGRFYGAVYQSIPRELRPHILIDNEPTVELDYGALHIRMLYHLKGIDYRDDPYAMLADNKEDRTKLKYVVLIAINASSEKRLPYTVVEQIKSKQEAGSNISSVTHKEVTTYIERFKAYHSDIAEYLCSDKGIELQNIDSTIMDNILNKCVRNSIPALPVHDSVIVRKKDQDFVYNLMMEEYKDVMNYYPIVDVK